MLNTQARTCQTRGTDVQNYSPFSLGGSKILQLWNTCPVDGNACLLVQKLIYFALQNKVLSNANRIGKPMKWVSFLSRNTSRRGSMLENVETESVFCHGHFTTGKHVGKCRNCVSLLSRNTSRRGCMLENVETELVASEHLHLDEEAQW
jgi:ribosomal protein L17